MMINTEKSIEEIQKLEQFLPGKTQEELEQILEYWEEIKAEWEKKKKEFWESHSRDDFKKLFSQYFLKSIKFNLPSFFNNIKFIYQYPQQKNKIQTIQDIVASNITEIESNNSVTKEIIELNKDNSNLNIAPVFIWVYYFSAQHYDILGESEKALDYINKAIKSTPSVV